jgi:hypothetical protein
VDYYDEAALLALDIDPTTVARLLADSPHAGHDGRTVIAAAALPDLLGLLEQEEGRAS